MLGLLAHDAVAHHLGQDRRRGHRGAVRVRVDDRSHQALEGLAVVAQQVGRAVDDEGRRDQGQPRKGAVGGHPPGFGHAPLVALGRAGVPDRPGVAPRADGIEDLLAPGLAELLGVAQPGRHGAQLDPGTQHRHADGERSRPGAATHLVDAAHPLEALLAQPALLAEARSADHGHARRLNTMGP